MARYNKRKLDKGPLFEAIETKGNSTKVQKFRVESLQKNVTDQYIHPLYLNEEWKLDAKNSYDSVPEVAVAIDLIAKMVASCDFDIKRESVDGDLIESDNHLAQQIMRSLKSEFGGRYQLIYTTAQNLQITGDGFLVGLLNPYYDTFKTNTNSFENPYSSWEFLSVHELKVMNIDAKDGNSTKYFRHRNGAVQKRKVSNIQTGFGEEELIGAYVARIWRPSPHFSGLSDSALKKNLIICKELLKLTDIINAASNSRLSSGMLLVPDELSFGPDEDIENEDSLSQEILEHMSSPVEDRSSSASLAPILFRGKADYLKEVRMVDLGQPFDAEYRATRAELIRRLVVGLDVPIEVIEGKSSVNHWTGHAIESEFASKHIVPLGDLIASRLTVGFLRPMLRLNGMEESEIGRMNITFNPSNILARADKESLARKLYELQAISEKALVEASGFSVADMPTPEERRQRTILGLIKTAPMNLGPILLPSLEGFEYIRDEIEEIIAKNIAKGLIEPSSFIDDDPKVNATKEFPDKQNDDDPRQKDGNQTPNPENQNKERGIGQDNEDTRHPTHSASNIVSPMVFGQLITLLDQWKKRSITLVSNKVISKAKSDSKISTEFSQINKKQILPFASQNEYFPLLGLDERKLFESSIGELRDSLEDFIVFNQGISVDDETKSALVYALVYVMESYILSNFKQEEVIYPNGLSIPDGLLEDILKSIENGLN